MAGAFVRFGYTAASLQPPPGLKPGGRFNQLPGLLVASWMLGGRPDGWMDGWIDGKPTLDTQAEGVWFGTGLWI